MLAKQEVGSYATLGYFVPNTTSLCRQQSLIATLGEVSSYASEAGWGCASLLVFTPRNIVTQGCDQRSLPRTTKLCKVAIALLLLPKGKNKASATEAATNFVRAGDSFAIATNKQKGKTKQLINRKLENSKIYQMI